MENGQGIWEHIKRGKAIIYEGGGINSLDLIFMRLYIYRLTLPGVSFPPANEQELNQDLLHYKFLVENNLTK